MTKLRSKKRKELSKISKVLISNNNSYVVRDSIFSSLTPKEIYQNFKELSLSHHFSKAINLTINTPANEMYLQKLPSANINKNLAWCMALIEFHEVRVRFFLDKKKEITKRILSGDFGLAIGLIDEVDVFCGVSTWSIITKSSVESLIDGSEPTNFLEKYGSKSKNQFLNYVLFYISGYFTDDEIYFTSRSTHKNDINRSAHNTVKDFFSYKFFDLDISSCVNIGSIYDVEKSSSIIDIFQLVISTLEYFIVTDYKFESVFDYEIKHVLKILEYVGYEPVENFRCAYGLKVVHSGNIHSMEIIDLYTSGDYESVLDIFNSSSKRDIDFSIVEIVSKAYSRVKVNIGDGFLSKIIHQMSNVLERNSEYDRSLEFLACISNSFRTLDWFKQLRHFVERESPNVSSLVRCNNEKGIHLFSCVYTPKKHILYSGNSKVSYLQFLINNLKGSCSLDLICSQYYEMYSVSNEKLSSNVNCNRLRKFNAIKLMDKGFYDEAEEILLELINVDDKLLRIEANRELNKLYIISKSYKKSILNFVDVSINNNKFFTIFDTKELLSSIDNSLQHIRNIDLPIAYALHSQNVDDSYDSSLKYSFENFLTLNGFTFPTELFGKEIYFGEGKLHYFLRWVCTAEVMKLYLNFETARQIEECRLEICNYLLDKVSDNDDLQFEIKQINKNLIVRKAVRQVENSRIYVDSSIFKGRRTGPYKALFDRYLELNSRSAPFTDDIAFGELLNVIASSTKNKPKDYWKSLSVIYVQDIKLSPKNATFLSLAKLMREEFTFGEKGINNYLSTRIRHGVLPTAIRKSSLSEGIYTPEQSKVEDYRDSLPKKTNLKVNESDIEKIWRISKVFTKKLENEISLFNDKKLQIYTLEGGAENKDKTEAMFNYSISPIETFAIQQELPLSPTYDDLLKVIMDWLWFRTDYILDEVKKYIRKKFTLNLNLIFESYRVDIQNSDISKDGKSTFTNAIRRAKNNLQNDLVTVGSWFEHVDSEGDGQFELNTAIEIAKRSLSINLNLTEKYECHIPQKDVSYWVDVFFILFDNAISKSNLEKNDVSLSVEIERFGDSVVIDISNNTKLVHDFEFNNSELDFYRNAYGNEELIRDVIQGEGGTGFFKIWKIMMRDLNIKHKIDFGYQSNNLFSVSLTLFDLDGVER